jgi:hypothetical protein
MYMFAGVIVVLSKEFSWVMGIRVSRRGRPVLSL